MSAHVRPAIIISQGEKHVCNVPHIYREALGPDAVFPPPPPPLPPCEIYAYRSLKSVNYAARKLLTVPQPSGAGNTGKGFYAYLQGTHAQEGNAQDFI